MRFILVGLALLVSAGVARGAELEVRVDGRIELLTIVQLLAGSEGRLTRLEFAYKQRVREQFAAFAEHDAVTLMREMARGGFTFDAPVTAILYHGPLPDLAERAPVDELTAQRAGSRERLDRFMEALRRFVVDAEVVAFLESEHELHETLVAQVRERLVGIDVGLLERYYGSTQASYTIIAAPLLHGGGFGPRVPDGEGRYHVYAVCGPYHLDGETPVFGKTEDFRYLVWHEFSHSFTNPIVDAHGAAFDRFAPLYEPLRRAMSRQAYGTWRTCVYEHLVRAVTTRFAFIAEGDEAGRKALQYERSRSFDYVDELVASLAKYEQQRDAYPDLASYGPQLVEVFEEIAANNPRLMMGQEAPNITRTVPAAGATDVSADLAEIRVEFDQDMDGGFSFVQRSAETFPKTTGKARWLTPRVCVLPVDLEPGRTYWIGLNSGRFVSFKSKAGVAADELILEFETAGE